MQYRCKIGTFEDDYWHYIPNKNTGNGCVLQWLCPCDQADTECIRLCLNFQCLGAKPLLMFFDDIGASIIKNQASAECQFKLHYPVPCIGDFTEGAFHIIVRAL